MTVLVDTARHPFRRMVMGHVIADSTEELIAAVESVGVRRRWIEKAGTAGEHFDLSLGKRRQLLATVPGSVLVTQRELGRLMGQRRRTPRDEWPLLLDELGRMRQERGVEGALSL